MKTIFKKIIKGTLAIFALKLIIVGGIFIFQSCQENDLNDKFHKESKAKFLESIKISNQTLNNIFIGKAKSTDELLARDIENQDVDIETICLQFLDGTNNTNEESNLSDILNNITSLSEILETKADYNLVSQFDLDYNNDIDSSDETSDNENDYDIEDCIAIIEIPTEPVSVALEPLVIEARNYLITTQGFTNAEIDEMIIEEGGEDIDLIPLVMAVSDYDNNQSNTAFNYSSIFVNSSYAQSMEDVGNCALQAIGADVLFSLASEAGSKPAGWKKKAIKKLFGKVASRFLGPIGVAIAVVTFGICLYGAA